jgi:hypothetical protein
LFHQGWAAMSNNTTFILSCSICGKPVPINQSESNHNGKAIHSECAAKNLQQQTRPQSMAS